VAKELPRYINPFDRKSIVITGGARGADHLAEKWCYTNGVHCAVVTPLWEHYSHGAGPLRNGAMLLLEPELVLAFPGGRGTADMIRQAREWGCAITTIV
jgi:hypothetical protein